MRVRVPWRLVTSTHYADAALAVYIKIAGLAMKSGSCEAGVAYLAGLLGLSRSAVERSLTQLMRPAPDDDVVELVSYRRTYHGGRGRTADRRVRRTDARRELGVWIPTRAPEALTPRQLRAYIAIAYAVARGLPVSYAELGQVLRHRTGKSAGQPLGQAAVARTVRGLADLGWITITERAGYQGRHLYTVHTEPIQPPLPAPSDGSGEPIADGSHATKEDPETDSPDDGRAGGFNRRRRDTGSYQPLPVDNPGIVPAVFSGSRPSAPRTTPYTGPALTLAPRIWHVMEPVRHLLPGLSPYVTRTLAREIGRQLDAGSAPDALRHRLQHRYARQLHADISDHGRWLLTAIRRHGGCHLADCESGRIWRTGAPCHICAQLRTAARPPGHPPGPERPTGPPPPPTRPTRTRTWCPCPDHPTTT
ncbi:helix-turn-helix domain-containing protein [Streptomyces albipurpureus]|uniref:Helix-turn-helix domain-containing protein n=1 Tax=Streptomyces albipurpureus TaxID=2897419 RepID=A0ABT0UP94_9ACTN|nr:helix-turn-helix domain-containing protein [Streptomyces sp. CWNU-1]MCM2390167.1 helix-turn-helix domain-containing protein [Streptomyces sp. CWNU-1]